MKLRVAGVLCFAASGVVLATAGVTFPEWQLFALLVIMLVNGWIENVRGRRGDA